MIAPGSPKAHVSIAWRRRSNRSERRYAASTRSELRWAREASAAEQGVSVHSSTQFRQLDRNPCGTAPMLFSLSSLDIVPSISGRPVGDGNTQLEPSV